MDPDTVPTIIPAHHDGGVLRGLDLQLPNFGLKPQACSVKFGFTSTSSHMIKL
jgi:hypothetical protein